MTTTTNSKNSELKIGPVAGQARVKPSSEPRISQRSFTMKGLAIALTVAVLIPTAASQAQVYYPRHDFGGGLRAQHHASTAAEGYLRGRADFMRAYGQYQLLMAHARNAHAAARQHEIANHKQAVQTYFSVRDHNRKKREAERRPRVSDQQIRRMAAAAKPAPLSPTDVDRMNGNIAWPNVLQDRDFGVFRVKLERAFASRATQGQTDGLTTAMAQQAARGMLDELRSQVRELPAQDYMMARRFVESLAHEIGQTAG
jgi:hypothetical protein